MQLSIKQYAQKYKMSQFQVIKLINSNQLKQVEIDGEKFIVEQNLELKVENEKYISSNFCTISTIVNGEIFVNFASLHVEDGSLLISCEDGEKLIGKNALLSVFDSNRKYQIKGRVDKNMRFLKE